MARALFVPGKQERFFETVRKHSGLSLKQLAQHCNVHSRTMRGWCQEKYRAHYETVVQLSKDFHVSLLGAKRINDYWYVTKGASRGGKKRFRLYGPLGTLEDRRKGGQHSQQRRREDPEKYRLLGCNVRKEFPSLEPSEDLAELVGILLGDGTITNYQVRVFLDKNVDKEYAIFVSKLIKKICGELPTWAESKREDLIILTLSGVALVDALEQIGLVRGDKIVHRVSIPDWVLKTNTYKVACVRGLFDTDGGFYTHRKEKDTYFGWSFASCSPPLLSDVFDILIELGLNVRQAGKKKISMYSFDSITRYMEIVGCSNVKNTRRFREYVHVIKQRVKSRNIRRGRIVV